MAGTTAGDPPPPLLTPPNDWTTNPVPLNTVGMVDVREATLADTMAVADVAIRSWQRGYRGLIAQDYLDGLRPQDRARRYAFGAMDIRGPYTLVALDGDTICGHITIGRSRDEDIADSGEIWALYVDPVRWGGGVGGALITAGCDRLRRAGHDRAALWVLSDNVRARRFYERSGFCTDGRERTDVIGGTLVHEVRYQGELGRQP